MPCSAASQRESAFYHILLGQLPSSLWSIPFAETPQAEEQPSATTSPRPEPKQSPQPKRQHSLPDPQGDTSIDKTSPMALQEGPSSSKRRETADWFASLKPSHTDAFSHDSDLVKEARSCYFATHPWDWIHGNTDDLSNIFKELAEGANLLGKSIHKLQLSWEGPEELRHANHSLRSLFTTQKVEVLKGSTCHGIPKDHGTEGNPRCWCPSTFCGLYLLSLVWQGGPKWGNCGQPSKDSPL